MAARCRCETQATCAASPAARPVSGVAEQRLAGPAQQPGQVGPLVGGRVVAAEGVDADHLVAAVDQGLGQVGADEAGRAGDDDVVATSGKHGPAEFSLA